MDKSNTETYRLGTWSAFHTKQRGSRSGAGVPPLCLDWRTGCRTSDRCNRRRVNLNGNSGVCTRGPACAAHSDGCSHSLLAWTAIVPSSEWEGGQELARTGE